VELTFGQRDDNAKHGRARVRRTAPLDGLARLQQQAGNAAVTAAVQRQLEVDGQPNDIAKVLKMLETASGLTLKRDAKKRITVTGATGKSRSAELTKRLQTILSDPSRVARVSLGRTGDGVWFGKFPGAPKGAQELRIDHILDLERAVPGAGVASLAHEIVENYEGQAIPASDWDTAHATVHPAAVAAADAVLEQLQQSAGQVPSGARLNTYLAEVKVPAKAGGRPTEKTLRIAAHRNEYFVFDVDLTGTSKQLVIRRAPVVSMGVVHVGGFTAQSTAVSKGATPNLQIVADLLVANPTVSLVFSATADAAAAARAERWYDLLWTAIADLMPSKAFFLLKDDERYHGEPVRRGSDNVVIIEIRRPDLP
jgi:hypothetical protein